METRYGIYKNGFVTDRGVTIEPILLDYSKTLIAAKKLANKKRYSLNHFIVKEVFDGLYWVSVENTEIEI